MTVGLEIVIRAVPVVIVRVSFSSVALLMGTHLAWGILSDYILGYACPREKGEELYFGVFSVSRIYLSFSNFREAIRPVKKK